MKVRAVFEPHRRRQHADPLATRIMRHVVRNPTRARDYALVGGLVLFNLDLICAFFWRYSQWPTAVLLGAWLLLVTVVAWNDDEALHDWWACWFVGILLAYLAVWGGWTMLDFGTASEFHPAGAVMAMVLGAWPAIILFLVIRGLIIAVLSRCRRFVAPDECRRCGYSLHGLDTPRCPECGTSFDPVLPGTAGAGSTHPRA